MRAKRTAVTAAFVVALAGGASGVAAADPLAPDPHITDPGSVGPPLPGPATPSASGPTTPSPATPAPAADAGPPSTLKSTIDADGTYAVGTDILPGVYSSAGPVGGGTCYWKRTSNPDGATIDNALTKKPQTVVIDPTDKSFKTNGCQPWQLTNGAAPVPDTPPDLAGLKLQAAMAQLNARAAASGQTSAQLPTP
jgi:hypothetical protein